MGWNTGTQWTQCEERLKSGKGALERLLFPLSSPSLFALCSLTLILHLGLEKAGWVFLSRARGGLVSAHDGFINRSLSITTYLGNPWMKRMGLDCFDKASLDPKRCKALALVSPARADSLLLFCSLPKQLGRSLVPSRCQLVLANHLVLRSHWKGADIFLLGSTQAFSYSVSQLSPSTKEKR